MIANEAINRAIDYILNHIGENITVEEVAAYCNFSRYYFSRLFKIETGEGIHAFIKRVRLEQSAFRLKVEKTRSITDISSVYGYSSSNYSWAFRQHHEQSPVEFRRSIREKSLRNPMSASVIGLEPLAECKKKISVEIHKDYRVLYQRYKGNYGELSSRWNQFQEKYSQYITDRTLFIERTYDDPSITDVDECLYDICMTIPDDCRHENTCIIEGGKFAVYHFEGNVGQIYGAYQSVFNVWLPQSSCSIDERYGFEIYRRIDCDTMNAAVDLCIPIQ